MAHSDKMEIDEKHREVRIAVFGPMGGGKSSVINLIVNSNVLPAHSGASSAVPTSALEAHFSDGSANYTLLEVDARLDLSRMCKDGLSLALLVMPKGRVADSWSTFKRATDILSWNGIPVIVVFTSCDFDRPISKWWHENLRLLRRQLVDFNPAVVVCVCALNTSGLDAAVASTFKKIKTNSRALLLANLDAHALATPVSIKLDAEVNTGGVGWCVIQ